MTREHLTVLASISLHSETKLLFAPEGGATIWLIFLCEAGPPPNCTFTISFS